MPSSKEMLDNGDAWYSVFCSIICSMNKEEKLHASEKFKKFIEDVLPNSDFNEEKRKRYLEAYKKAYYHATSKTYPQK